MSTRFLSRRFVAKAGLASALLLTTSCGPQTTQQKMRVTSKDGTLIAFERSGQGPALIVVGGALSDRSASAPLAKLLALHYTVLAYDRRGRGDSGDTQPYAVAREVEDIDALIDEAGGTAFVHGHSSGAVLGLTAARTLSTKIKKLALYEPPFIVDDSRLPPPQDYVEQIKALVAAGRRGDAVAFFMTEVVGTPAPAVAQMRKAPTWAAMEALAHTLPYDGAVLGDTMAGKPLAAERWASVTTPTVVMDGGASPAWIRRSAQALAAILPGAQHRTLDGQTHAVAPDVIAPELKQFFVG